MSTVPFTEKDVKAYLDDCIVFWRKEKNTVDGDPVMAAYYIDAFQSVRVSLFGELLPK